MSVEETRRENCDHTELVAGKKFVCIRTRHDGHTHAKYHVMVAEDRVKRNG